MQRTSDPNRERRQEEGHPDSSLADDRILTSREARLLLKIGRTKLHELTRDQVIRAYRIGPGKTSGLRYRRSDLLRWLLHQKV